MEPIGNDKLYEEIGRTWRHFASWREKAFAGYLTVLAALAVGFAHCANFPERAGIFAGALLTAVVFWILDFRNLLLMNACQHAARPIEADKGCYSELIRVRYRRKTPLTHGFAINLVVTPVCAASISGLWICVVNLTNTGKTMWPHCAFIVGLLLLPTIFTIFYTLADKERSRDAAQHQSSKIDEAQVTPSHDSSATGRTDNAMDPLDNYVLEQAKIEIDHTRSWPTKALAFFVTTNFGLVGALIGLRNTTHPLNLQRWERVLLSILIGTLAAWAIRMLFRNHQNYLKYRNLQIQFQRANLQNIRDKYQLPPDWFVPNDVRFQTRFWEWRFYLYIVVFIAITSIVEMLFVL